MRILYGYSGWIRVETDDLPGWLYLRLAKDSEGRWRTHELYLDGQRPITAGLLRRLPLSRIEALALQGDGADRLEASMMLPGPQLSIMAETFTSRLVGSRPNCEACGGLVHPRGKHRALDWLETSRWAQHPEIKVARPRRPREGLDYQPSERLDPPAVKLSPPPDGRLTDHYLRHVAAAYNAAISSGSRKPAKVMSTQAGVSERTVHRWIYTARKRGILGATKQGRVG